MPQRKNAFKLTKVEQDAYMNAVTAMIKDGTYGALVSIHADMTHNMHNMGTIVSMLRFLPWHRAYLVHMEAELQRKDKNAFIPYWHWTDGGVPAWLVPFKPTVNGVKNNRTILAGAITTVSRIEFLLKVADYNTFTNELELDPHNRGHLALGPPMTNVPTAPCDPIFWMHHAEVDRVWARWQATHPGLVPILSSKDAIMDPWTDTVASLGSISKLGYSYV